MPMGQIIEYAKDRKIVHKSQLVYWQVHFEGSIILNHSHIQIYLDTSHMSHIYSLYKDLFLLGHFTLKALVVWVPRVAHETAPA